MNATQVRYRIRNTTDRQERNALWAWLGRYSKNKTIAPFPDDYGRHKHGGWFPHPMWAGYVRCGGCELTKADNVAARLHLVKAA